ncbi:thiamine pyrophosphate-dependent dehydrogenase E1 component subunit alpha [Micromonospora eburnea]|nr:thiamine pyrophosphate-dependent dehydrogenase E1 component subunit alpha [Micromonospora eburnea]
MIQLLSPGGTLSADPRAPLHVTPGLCRDLYRDMVLARRFDEEALVLQRQGELGLWLMALGQEAAQVGSIRALTAVDHVFPSYREHAAALCRGISPAELLAQWRGVAHSGWDPARYRFHIYTLVLGAQTLHATGYALGVRLDGAPEVVLTYFGDGASSQGDVNEALNWAAVTSAPIVFFCQNNQWAISTATSQQMGAPLHSRAAGFGLDAYHVDGNDALAVYAVTAKAAEAVREGGRPALIEAHTYRIAGHSTSDDPRIYRPESEVERWRGRDPISRLAILLKDRGWADEQYFDELDSDARKLAEETRAACLSLPDPMLEDTFRHTFADEPPLLREERERMSAYRASFADGPAVTPR